MDDNMKLKKNITHIITDHEYYRIHYWLKTKFKKSTTCESSTCRGISKKIEWALKKGKKYETKRENFICLCKSCHIRYDMTENTKAKISKLHKGRVLTDKQLKKRYVAIDQYTLSGVYVRSFESATEAEKLTGISRSSISNSIRGHYHSSGGFKWQYAK